MSSSDKIKVEISKSREIRPYADLWHGANVLEGQANEDPKGSMWKYMSSLILSAFAWEAFLNQLGELVIDDWRDIERKLNTKEKVKTLAKKIGKTVDLGRSPYHEIRELMEFRDQLAHPKPDNIKSVVSVFDEPEKIDELISERPETDWEKLCTKPEVRRLRSCVEVAIVDLHTKAEIDNPVFVSGLGLTSASVKK